MLAAVDPGAPRAHDLRLFGVSLATTRRWLKRRRETGEVAPRPSPGRTPSICKEEERRGAKRAVAAAGGEPGGHAGAPLRAVGARARGEGVSLDDEPRRRARARVDLQAKTVGAAERDEGERRRWRERVGRLDPKKLVFVDECGSNVGLVPLRARAPKGERAYGKAPRRRNRGPNTTTLLARA